MTKTWKDALLSSGLPLEYEVKKYFDSKGCVADFEFSYLRPNETNVDRQFSYDVDASYIDENFFVSFMVECKYRHPTTQWVFTPDSYSAAHELDRNAFMHPLDHFTSEEFPFRGSFPRQLGPACSKGIELSASGCNDKSINQALAQLAYAFAPKIAGSIESQLSASFADFIFYHVPIVATTADLYRLKDDVSIEELRQADNLEQVASPESCLVVKYSIGVELRQYNQRVIAKLRETLGDSVLRENLQSSIKDLDHLFSVLAEHYSPEAIIVIKADKSAFDYFFNYVNELLKPSETLLSQIKEQRDATQKRIAQWTQALLEGESPK